MKIIANQPPRTYRCGRQNDVDIADCGTVALEAGEQLTFVTPCGGEVDVTRTQWGFYAAPSLNGRLGRFGIRPALIANADAKYFVLLIERGHEEGFAAYLEHEGSRLVGWLDDDATLAVMDAACRERT